MNVASWLRRAALAYGDLPAIAAGDSVVLSYARMARRAAGLATAFRESCGLGVGDRVAIAAQNHPAYLEALFGVWWAGLVAVPINAKLHAKEIAWIVEHAQASAVFVSPDLEPAVGALDLPGVDLLECLGGVKYERLAASEPAALAPREADQLAWLFYTSGTTGRPKGAMLSHRNLMAMSLAHLADVDPTDPGDALIHCAPLSHGSGLLCLPHVCRFGVNVIPDSGGFEPSEVLGLGERWRAASLFAAPTMVRRLVDAAVEIDTGAWRTMMWGGAPMHVADTQRAFERFGPCLAQIYGQGETPMTITALSKRDVRERDNPRYRERMASAGTARSVVEVRVAHEADEPTAAKGLGEVLVRGDTVMAGYWQDPDATAAALRGGWLHTGDIGAFDEDGYLTLLDRAKDLIISGGSNIYPREVEEILISHPDVTEVSVIGRPDPEWGEIVVAYVVGEADSAELDHLCLDRIARFKRPKDYVFVSSLPKSNYGKILKTELRERDLHRQEAGPVAVVEGCRRS